MKDKVSVLVNSCDKYEEAWKPFFVFFRKYWYCPYKVFLNTETKTCSEQGVTTLNSGANKLSWSSRLKKALKRLKTEYVIFILEDFFLLSDVNQKEIERCIGIMDRDKKIPMINFDHKDKFAALPSKYEGYNVKSTSAMYFLSCRVSLWRRKDFIRFLSPYENPWQFEIYGSDRAKLYNKTFLITASKEPTVFNYRLDEGTGFGLFRGKWLRSNEKLFADNGINVDFTTLGFYEEGKATMDCPEPKKCFKERWMYFLFGGGEKVRMGIFEQIKFAFCHPRKNLSVLKRKCLYFFTNKRDV